jgi:NADH-quinone oxidoreductase subunit N
LYYTYAYALAGIAAFAVIIFVSKNKGNEDLANFNGLGKTNPVMAGILTASLLSMAGIPVFSGFFAKFMLFTQTIEAGYLVVVIAGVINSIISIGYYFKLILAMYTKEPSENRTGTPILIYGVAVIAILLNLAIGLFPSLVLNLLG